MRLIPGSRFIGLKSQFVKIHALRCKGSQSKQSQFLNGESGRETQSSIPFAQLHDEKTWFGQTTHALGNELLAYWDTQNSRFPLTMRKAGPGSVAEQKTLQQQATVGPKTDLASDVNGTQTHMLAHGQMPLSPNLPGITPLAAMKLSSQSCLAPQPPSMPYAGIQQLSPFNGPITTSQPLMNPMLSSSMPTGHNGAGGNPSGHASPSPDMGKPDSNPKKRSFPIWARIAVSVFLLLLIVVGCLAGYYYYNFSAPVSHIVGQQVTRLKGDMDPNAIRNGADILSGSRINILLLGSDTDQKFTNADGSHNYLAQSDIVITIDPASRNVGMLSIPRDFWINVPGSGMHKLDEAYSLGGTATGAGAYSPGGVALSRLTIFQDFGIPINYYAWVGLDGFVKVIDTVGGVDVDVLHPITDDNYPDDVGNHSSDIFAYKRLYIPPGPQHLSGREALEYVRSRHADLVGDFGRSARQQQVLSALKTKLDNPDIVSKLPEIANDLNGYVKTDMQLSDVFKLMNFARSLNPNSIHRVILGPPYSSIGFTEGGRSVVFPDCGKIVPMISQMFALGDKAACNIQANSSNNAIASASEPSSTINNSASTNSLPAMTQMASASALNFSGGNDNLSGFHSLLDLMLMVALESPQAMQA
jgi:LCP family protein required for cell wall assembly